MRKFNSNVNKSHILRLCAQLHTRQSTVLGNPVYTHPRLVAYATKPHYDTQAAASAVPPVSLDTSVSTMGPRLELDNWGMGVLCSAQTGSGAHTQWSPGARSPELQRRDVKPTNYSHFQIYVYVEHYLHYPIHLHGVVLNKAEGRHCLLFTLLIQWMSRHSLVSIATAVFLFLAGATGFYLFHSARRGSGAHPASYTMTAGGGGLLPKRYRGRSERLTIYLHLVPSSKMVKLCLHTTPSLHSAFTFFNFTS
jgi:hypothetical protein